MSTWSPGRSCLGLNCASALYVYLPFLHHVVHDINLSITLASNHTANSRHPTSAFIFISTQPKPIRRSFSGLYHRRPLLDLREGVQSMRIQGFNTLVVDRNSQATSTATVRRNPVYVPENTVLDAYRDNDNSALTSKPRAPQLLPAEDAK